MATGPGLVFGQLTFPLNKVTNSVGRKDRITNMVPDVDLGTLDQERSVSRRQAELTYDKGVVSLRDVGSTNGSTVNGERLVHQVERQLKDGDEVGFGGVTMTFRHEAEWPDGIEAEWPPEVPEAAPEETMIAGPQAEETMVAGPMAEETMVAGPMAEETMVAPPAGFDAAETSVFTPPAADEPAADEPAALEPAALEPSALEPSALEPSAAAEPMAQPAADEPEPVAAAPEPVEAYAACSNHSHLPAVGLCPGCLEPFCVDCLPEREDGLMVCNRCAGISYRLAVAVQAVPAPSAAAGGFGAASPPPPFPAPSGGLPAPVGGMPGPSSMPAPAPIPGAAPPPDGGKKKRWPF